MTLSRRSFLSGLLASTAALAAAPAALAITPFPSPAGVYAGTIFLDHDMTLLFSSRNANGLYDVFVFNDGGSFRLATAPANQDYHWQDVTQEYAA